MRRRRWLALAAGSAVLVLSPVMAGAAPLNADQIYKPYGFFRFCAEAQIELANIDEDVMGAKGITVGGTIYDDFNGLGDSTSDFVKSKSAVDLDDKKILTSTAILYGDEARTKPETILCKLRTGESISKGAWPPGTPNNGGRFVVDPAFGFGEDGEGVSTDPVDKPCLTVNQQTIDTVWDDIVEKGEPRVYPKPTVVPGQVPPLVIGPNWLLAQIPPVSVVDEALQVKSNDLVTVSGYANAGNWEGAHYCTFVAPQYLHDLIVGDAVVD